MNRSSNPKKHYASAVYEVNSAAAVDLGTVATHIPKQSSIIPDNAIITEVVIETLTTFVGGAHTLTVNAGGVDITAATSIANRSQTVPYTTVLPKKATGIGAIKVTVATAIITSGKANIIVGYYMSGE